MCCTKASTLRPFSPHCDSCESQNITSIYQKYKHHKGKLKDGKNLNSSISCFLVPIFTNPSGSFSCSNVLSMAKAEDLKKKTINEETITLHNKFKINET